MNIYKGKSIKLLKTRLKHPIVEELPDEPVNCWPSLQTVALRGNGSKILTGPVLYKYSKIAERHKIPLPLISVVGISEFDGKVLFGIRSRQVRFPGFLGAAPAGHLDYPYRPREVILKELSEELGVSGEAHFLGAQLSPLYLGLLFRIELESGNLKPNWEWSNLMWVQKGKLRNFLETKGEKIHPAFAAPFLLYLNWLGEDVESLLASKHLNLLPLKELNFGIRSIEQIFSEWSRGQKQALANP